MFPPVQVLCVGVRGYLAWWLGAGKTNQTGKFSRDDSAVILAGGLDPQSPLVV